MQKFLSRWVLMLVGAVCFMVSGCSSLVSPYSSKLQCPNTYKGKCVSVETAYAESINNPLIKHESSFQASAKDVDGSRENNGDAARKKQDDPKYQYQEALYHRLASLIEEPSTPIVVPPEVMRVLILSYTGSDNELFSYRYVYFFATQPKWIISTGKEVR